MWASKRGRVTTLPPLSRAVKSWAVRPKLWKNGMTPTYESRSSPSSNQQNKNKSMNNILTYFKYLALCGVYSCLDTKLVEHWPTRWCELTWRSSVGQSFHWSWEERTLHLRAVPFGTKDFMQITNRNDLHNYVNVLVKKISRIFEHFFKRNESIFSASDQNHPPDRWISLENVEHLHGHRRYTDESRNPRIDTLMQHFV